MSRETEASNSLEDGMGTEQPPHTQEPPPLKNTVRRVTPLPCRQWVSFHDKQHLDVHTGCPPCPLTPQQFSGEGWHPLSIWGRLVPFPQHGCSGHLSLALRVMKTQPRPGRRPAGHADRTLPESQRLISKCFVPLRLLLLVLSFDAVFGSVHARFVKSCV